MLFSSITFLYFYLPLVLCCYFIAPKAYKNGVLFFSSLVFYGWGEPKYVLLMLCAIALGYSFGLLIEHFQGTAWAKWFLILSVTSSLCILGVFKYADFFITTFRSIFPVSIGLLRLSLPIGISFYTFQIMSYTIDVYHQKVPAQHNFISLGIYICLFPQLIAGPIVRYADISYQLEHRTHSFAQAETGATRFLIGLSKKVLLANQLGELCNQFHMSTDKSVLYYWLYALAFALHLYFDFSGYSDMAIGLGAILGFQFPENFRYPFVARSITDFWRRWHISLGTWFRDYVYIPLGGNRCSRVKWVRNLFVVWFLTGLWHGAAWNFIIWGLFFALLLLFEKAFLHNILSRSRVLCHLYVLPLLLLSFVIFDASSLSDAFTSICCMFGFGLQELLSVECIYYVKSYGVLLILGVIAATPFPQIVYQKMRQSTKLRPLFNLLEVLACFTLLLLVTAFLVDGSFNPFLYFRF